MTDEEFTAWLHRQGKPETRALRSWQYGDPAKMVRFERERKQNMTGQELHAHCEQWRHWCITRQYFIAPGAKNILARMQPSRVCEPPDTILSDEMSFFNMAVHALADMGNHDTECFVKYYWFRLKNIKKVSADMGISRDTFYERKSRFAKLAYSMAQSLKRAHAVSLQELNGESDID